MDPISVSQESYDFKAAKKQFSRIGLALVAFFAATEVSSLLVQLILLYGFSILEYSAWGKVAISCFCMYGIGVPTALLCLRGTKVSPPQRVDVRPRTFVVLFLISYAVSYIGSMAGTLATALFEKYTGLYISSAAIDLISELPWPVTLVYAVVLAPLFEELVFRKWILDRTRAYGEKTAIVFSALLFGFFHMNLQQFFYAFLVGLVLSYLYIRTGKLTACWLLHGVYNLFGGLLPSLVLRLVDYDALLAAETLEEQMLVVEQNFVGYTVMLVYGMLVFGAMIAGAVLLMIYRKKLYFVETECKLPRDSEASTAFANVGVGLFILLSILMPILLAAIERFV